ncbi:hypothetical protein TNIN_244351 [Trichonephila inaurata madagascariensis]|uniref:Uncharacterized protein n=1 Tax=Trichonephila inaurata madagascariensis TaxID=2747483 RepID=A0A8X6WNP3_9ARAC|nr:hypothetical protein TNIN_244351 [Trichonephila inaurata madagascariensis]
MEKPSAFEIADRKARIHFSARKDYRITQSMPVNRIWRRFTQEAEDGKLHPWSNIACLRNNPAEENIVARTGSFAVINALKKFRTYLLGNNQF